MAALLQTEPRPTTVAQRSDEIETARLRLRLFTPADLPALSAITSDPDVMRYIGHGHTFSREETRANLEVIISAFRRRGYGRWALERRDTGEFIGYCGLSSGNKEVGIELAYMLARSEWGKGLALEAGRASLRYGFEVLGFESIAGLTLPENLRSRRVLERLGMRFIRHARYYNFACVHYALARDDWRDDDSPYRIIQ